MNNQKTTDSILLIGDLHGLFYDYRQILKNLKPAMSIALGDIGIGFDPNKELVLNDIPGIHKILRGNHDSPTEFRKHPNNIGDYGILHGEFIDGLFDKLFFLSGAWSIDKEQRTEGIDWWADEQLSYEELSDAVNLHNKEQPDLVIAHDCPTSVLLLMHPYNVIPTRTSQALDIMIQNHKPSYFIFAHHHKSWRKNIDGCLYICLNELEFLDISKRITGGNI